uniref:Cysteine-rich venom-like protein n=1 Tax=Simulium guianense TaxID=445764 RepID=F5GTW3_SIMGU
MNKLSIGVLVLIGFIGLLFVVDALDPACQASGPRAGCNGKNVYTFTNKRCTIVKSCQGESSQNQFATGKECAEKCLLGSRGKLGGGKQGKAGKKGKGKNKNAKKIENLLNKPLN